MKIMSFRAQRSGARVVSAKRCSCSKIRSASGLLTMEAVLVLDWEPVFGTGTSTSTSTSTIRHLMVTTFVSMYLLIVRNKSEGIVDDDHSVPRGGEGNSTNDLATHCPTCGLSMLESETLELTT